MTKILVPIDAKTLGYLRSSADSYGEVIEEIRLAAPEFDHVGCSMTQLEFKRLHSLAEGLATQFRVLLSGVTDRKVNSFPHHGRK